MTDLRERLQSDLTDRYLLARELEDRGALGYASSTGAAVLLAGLGDTVQAFVNDPLLDGLRNTPRGKALLRRMRLASSESSPS